MHFLFVLNYDVRTHKINYCNDCGKFVYIRGGLLGKQADGDGDIIIQYAIIMICAWLDPIMSVM